MYLVIQLTSTIVFALFQNLHLKGFWINLSSGCCHLICNLMLTLDFSWSIPHFHCFHFHSLKMEAVFIFLFQNSSFFCDILFLSCTRQGCVRHELRHADAIFTHVLRRHFSPIFSPLHFRSTRDFCGYAIYKMNRLCRWCW